jgi:hypothetical protein
MESSVFLLLLLSRVGQGVDGISSPPNVTPGGVILAIPVHINPSAIRQQKADQVGRTRAGEDSGKEGSIPADETQWP